MSSRLEKIIRGGFPTKNIERNFHLKGLSPEEQKIYEKRNKQAKQRKKNTKLIIPSKINKK